MYSEHSSHEKEGPSNSQIKRILRQLSSDYRSVLERLKVCLIVVLAYAFLAILGIGCPMKVFTGISCPGCGMTRAILSALMLRFDRAFDYHPLFFLMPGMLLLFLFNDFIKKNVKTICWALIIIAFLAVYLYRLFYSYAPMLR